MAPTFESKRLAIVELLRGISRYDLPHPFRVTSDGRPAAVLILVGLSEGSGDPEILVTRRPDTIATHKGQYALPGGMRDHAEEGAEETALRETQEEMGISASLIEVVGRLPEIWTPSGFTITPVIGVLRKMSNEVEVVPNPSEVDTWFWCPLARLRDEGVYFREEREITFEGKSRIVPVDVYQIDSHRIWGATGAILRNLIARLEKSESGI